MKPIILTIFLSVAQITMQASSPTPAIMQSDEIDAAQAAIFVKDLALLKQAIANGSDVNQKLAFTWQVSASASIRFEKATLLMYAISVNWYDGVLELLKSGAKSNVYVKGIKPVNMDFDRCPVKEIAEMSDMMMAVWAGNADIVKLMIIDGCDTRGTMAVELQKNCTASSAPAGLMNMRSLASEEINAILKEGKKAEWAKNGLPAEGKKPGS
jgi:hypothetical protein